MGDLMTHDLLSAWADMSIGLRVVTVGAGVIVSALLVATALVAVDMRRVFAHAPLFEEDIDALEPTGYGDPGLRVSTPRRASLDAAMRVGSALPDVRDVRTRHAGLGAPSAAAAPPRDPSIGRDQSAGDRRARLVLMQRGGK